MRERVRDVFNNKCTSVHDDVLNVRAQRTLHCMVYGRLACRACVMTAQ